MSIQLHTAVHFTGHPTQTGTVKSARNAVLTARGGGRSFQRTVKVIQYFVDWNNGDPSDWYRESELVKI